jgi:hypothetical protein
MQRDARPVKKIANLKACAGDLLSILNKFAPTKNNNNNNNIAKQNKTK